MSKQMKLDDLLANYLDGDEHGWTTEFEYLRREHGGRIRSLMADVLKVGIREPVLLGRDGRVWDGHHRLYVAHALGFKFVPTQMARATSGAPNAE